jgi:hypothetical protein
MDSENGMYSGASLAASLRGFSPKEVSSELEAIPEFKYEGIELGDENGDYSLCWYPEGRILGKLPADTVCRLAVIKNRKGMTPWDVAVQRYRHLFSSEGPDELRLSEGFQKLAALVAPEKSMREICLEIEGARGVRGMRVYSAARAAEFAGCLRKQHGMKISEPDAKTFLSHLAEEGILAASDGKQFYCFKSGDPLPFRSPFPPPSCPSGQKIHCQVSGARKEKTFRQRAALISGPARAPWQKTIFPVRTSLYINILLPK